MLVGVCVFSMWTERWAIVCFKYKSRIVVQVAGVGCVLEMSGPGSGAGDGHHMQCYSDVCI